MPESAGFPDNWIYIHSPDVQVGRVQNFGSWSPYMVKDGRTCLGLEYFVNEGDALWESTDAELVALAGRELAELGLVDAGAVTEGYVVRMPKAYPVYDAEYAGHVDTMRAWLAEHAPNVHPVGRNGMHRYNNQDHSMLTALLTAAEIRGAGTGQSVWEVNVEDDYHEEQTGRRPRGGPVEMRRFTRFPTGSPSNGPAPSPDRDPGKRLRCSPVWWTVRAWVATRRRRCAPSRGGTRAVGPSTSCWSRCSSTGRSLWTGSANGSITCSSSCTRSGRRSRRSWTSWAKARGETRW